LASFDSPGDVTWDVRESSRVESSRVDPRAQVIRWSASFSYADVAGMAAATGPIFVLPGDPTADLHRSGSNMPRMVAR
jgi:hypothetical protein